MPREEQKHAVWVTDKAKDTVFIDSEIEGFKNEGERTQVFRTKIFNYRKKHPGAWWTIITGIIVAVVSGVILLLIEYNVFT